MLCMIVYLFSDFFFHMVKTLYFYYILKYACYNYEKKYIIIIIIFIYVCL